MNLATPTKSSCHFRKFPSQAKPCSRWMIRPKPNVTNIPSGNRHSDPRKSSSCNHCCSKRLLYQLFASHRQPAEQSARPLSEVSMCSRADINSLWLLCTSWFICQQPVTVKTLNLCCCLWLMRWANRFLRCEKSSIRLPDL